MLSKTNQRLHSYLKATLLICSLLTIIEVINIATGRSLNTFGLIPRDTSRLYGVITSPFLHGSFSHFTSNIIPLALFSLLIQQYGTRRYWLITTGIIIGTGILVWIFGRTSLHIGASGLVFGYFGFLIVAGITSREFKQLAIALLVGITYGSMIWGVLPLAPGVSFESHFFGIIVGGVIGYNIGKTKKNTQPNAFRKL